MKKEIKSYEELLKCDGMKFEATYKGETTKGIIFVDSNKDVFCLQNDFYGSRPIDDTWERCGYEGSWVQFKHLAYGYTDCKTTFKNIFVEVEEEWNPKFGEVVEVSNGKGKWFKRIFIGEYDGVFHCIKEGDESYFKKDTLNGYNVLQWGNIRRYEEPKIELNIDEARKIIAENKGVKPENVTIKVL